MEELRGFRIGLPKGFTHQFVAERLPQAALSVYDDFDQLYHAAHAGEVRVFISPLVNYRCYLHQSGSSEVFDYDANNPLYQRTYYGAVREDDIDLRQLIDQGMARIDRDEREAIERKWLGQARIAGPFGRPSTPYMACRNDWPELAGILQKGLNAISEAEHRRIRRRWISLKDTGDSAHRLKLPPQEHSWLQQHSVVHTVGDSNWAPVEYTDQEGGYRGISADYLNPLGRRLGIEFAMVPRTSLRGLHALVVEDNPSTRQILSDMLTSFAFDVVTVANAEAALAQIHTADQQRQPFDLVLMDWRLPVLNGIEATRPNWSGVRKRRNRRRNKPIRTVSFPGRSCCWSVSSNCWRTAIRYHTPTASRPALSPICGDPTITGKPTRQLRFRSGSRNAGQTVEKTHGTSQWTKRSPRS